MRIDRYLLEPAEPKMPITDGVCNVLQNGGRESWSQH
jgi:hypothetical protein